MALGNSTAFNGGPLVFLNPRSKDKDGKPVSPHYAISRVGEDGKIAPTTKTATNVSGDLIKIETKDREFTIKATGQKDTIKEAVLYIKDPAAKETYRLPVTFGIAGYGLMNSLANLVDKGNFTNLQIDYYRNKKDFDTFGLKQNNEQVKWKYSLEEVPQKLPIKDSKGKVIKNDYSLVDDFYVEVVEQIAAKVNKADSSSHPAETAPTIPAPKTPAQNAPAKITPPVNTPPAAENLDEDVPF